VPAPLPLPCHHLKNNHTPLPYLGPPAVAHYWLLVRASASHDSPPSRLLAPLPLCATFGVNQTTHARIHAHLQFTLTCSSVPPLPLAINIAPAHHLAPFLALFLACPLRTRGRFGCARHATAGRILSGAYGAFVRLGSGEQATGAQLGFEKEPLGQNY